MSDTRHITVTITAHYRVWNESGLSDEDVMTAAHLCVPSIIPDAEGDEGASSELIESSSRSDELVLDPCAGSGATGVAAILRGRRCLLIESHEKYARLAAERVAEAERIIKRAEAA